MEHSWLLIVAMIGHILCVYADRLLLCTPDGQLSGQRTEVVCCIRHLTAVRDI